MTTKRISFGCRAKLDDASKVAELGFDFFEATVSLLIPGEDDAAFADLHASLGKLVRKPEVFHDIMPPDMPILGDDIPYARNRRWIRRVIRRAKRLGGKLIVVHSPGVRHCPPEVDPQRANIQFSGFVRVLGEYAAKARVHAAIDPLPPGVAGVAASTAEVAALATESESASIRMALDIWFGCGTPQSVTVSRAGASRLSYVRIHLPSNCPNVMQRCAINPLFRSLKQAGFTGRVCLLPPDGELLAPSPEYAAWLRSEWIRS